MKEQLTQILLVEDEKAHADLVCRAFVAHRQRFHLTVADSLAEARACLAEVLPQLIIADLRLPDGLGTDLIPAEEEDRTIPLVVMTAQGDQAAAVQSMKAGALDYVVKSEAILVDMPHIAERALREWYHITERKRIEERERLLARENQVLAEIGRIVSSSLDINDIYERLSEKVQKLIPFDHMSVTIIDATHGVTKPTYIAGTDVAGRKPGDRVPLAGTLAEEVASKRSPKMLAVESEAELRDRFPGLVPAFRSGLRSFLAVPLINHDAVISVLQIRSKTHGIYTQDHLDLADRVGNQIAGAIANVQLFTERSRLGEENLVLAEIGRIISSSLAIEDVYKRFADEVRKLIPFDRIVVGLVDLEQDTFSPAYIIGPTVKGRGVGDIIPLAGSATEEVIRGKASLLMRADTDEEYLNRFPATVYRARFRSIIAVPLISKDQVIGFLRLQSIDRNAYTERDLVLLGSVGNQIAGAIANAQLYEARKQAEEEERQAALENKLLAEVGRIVSSSLHIEEVYRQFSQEVSKLMSFENINIVTVNHDQSNFTIRYHDGLVVSGRELGQTVSLAGSATERVVRDCKGHLWHSVDRVEIERSDPGRLPNFDAGLRSFLSVPLIFRDTVIGVLHLRSRKPNAYTDRDLALVERIGLQIAPALENARLYQETRKAEESERQRSKELGGLLEVSRILNHPDSFEDKVSRVMEELARICDADSAAFRLPYEGGLRRIGSTGEQPEDTTFVPYEGSIAGLVYQNNEIVVVNDYPNHPLAIAGRVRLGFKSLFAAPIGSQDSVVGVVIVNSRYPNHFNADRVNLLLGFINGLGSLFENARLEDERLQAVQELRESERRFRQISENMRQSVFLVDHQDNKVLYVNGAFEEIWGRPRENIYENRMVWIDAVHPDDRTRVEAAFNNQQTTGVFEEEFRIVRPDGTIRWIYDQAFAIRNEVGEVYRLVGMAEDITDRKETEQRIQETARLASIGELAAGVAHEINNPLTSVLGYSQMVLNNELPEEVAGDVQVIHDEAQRAAKIVQNLLFFARKSATEKQHLDLNSVLIRSLEMKSYDFKVSNIEVVSQLSPEIRKTMVDEHQLVQVFLNILTNAEQAIHAAGGKGQIEVCTAISDGEIEITIEDDGPGMPSEVLNRIFEPFFTTKGVGQGTGLGLSISYGIIKQHGGDIWADSVEGEGTTFHITLPVVLPEELAVFQVPASTLAGKTTKHLLVVDDEPHIRDLLRKYLELERYTVDLSGDGQEAWRKLAAMEYDCILLDLKMPGMSGQELYQLIQGISESLASKVVFITGDTVSPDTRDFISQTGNPLVTKPFRLEELLRTVHDLWEKASLIQHSIPTIPKPASQRMPD